MLRHAFAAAFVLCLAGAPAKAARCGGDFNSFITAMTAEAQAAGAIVAMTSNFIMNNFLTYRDQRLKGFAILRGLIMFYIVCSVGLLANVGVAFSVYDQEPIWWLAGAAGALMGVVWNYAMSGLFVWRKR